jgi:hypothetical protein
MFYSGNDRIYYCSTQCLYISIAPHIQEYLWLPAKSGQWWLQDTRDEIEQVATAVLCICQHDPIWF